MRQRSLARSTVPLAMVALSLGSPLDADAQGNPAPRWRQHEIDRPRPAVVTPVPQQLPAPVPADAVVLFGGRDLAGWVSSAGGRPAQWKVEGGYLEVVPGTGQIQSQEEFGDVQLHVEWASPNPPRGTSQDRGNSGVFLMGRYEIQVLDVYQANTYADGQAGAIYGQYPPLFNAARAPGEWQAYDIFFRRPRFASDGALVEPARVTVVHNGILVQNNEIILGPTTYQQYAAYTAHADRGPIALQDHGHPVRFRNIWARRLPDRPAPGPQYMARAANLTSAQLDRFVGAYFRANSQGQQGGTAAYTITREGNTLMVRIGNNPPQIAVPVSADRLWLTRTAATIAFKENAQGGTEVTFDMGGQTSTATRRENR